MSEVFLEKCFFITFFGAPLILAEICFPSFENKTVAEELPANCAKICNSFKSARNWRNSLHAQFAVSVNKTEAGHLFMRIKWAQMSTRNENCETYSSAAPVLAAGVIACRTMK